MNYKASEKLAQIFIQNGFVENTETKYSEHFEKAKKEGYNPSSMKRSFSYKTLFSINFNYIKIDSFGMFTFFSCYALTDNDLKCVITYMKLSVYDRKFVRENVKEGVLAIANYYERICKFPEIYKRKPHLRLKEIFNSITLE